VFKRNALKVNLIIIDFNVLVISGFDRKLLLVLGGWCVSKNDDRKAINLSFQHDTNAALLFWDDKFLVPIQTL
jgi:hypothetical protein